jgi:hypothetical protein
LFGFVQEEVQEEPIVEMHGAIPVSAPDTGRVEIDQLALLLNAQPPLPEPSLPTPVCCHCSLVFFSASIN